MLQIRKTESSFIQAVGFDADTSEIVICMGGRAYRYNGCSRDEFESIAFAKLPGQAFGLFRATAGTGVRLDTIPEVFTPYLAATIETPQKTRPPIDAEKEARKRRAKAIEFDENYVPGSGSILESATPSESAQGELGLGIEAPKKTYEYPG